MEEVLKIIDKHLADNLLDSYNPIRLLETIRAEIVNLGQFEQKVHEIIDKKIAWNIEEDKRDGTNRVLLDYATLVLLNIKDEISKIPT